MKRFMTRGIVAAALVSVSCVRAPRMAQAPAPVIQSLARDTNREVEAESAANRAFADKRALPGGEMPSERYRAAVAQIGLMPAISLGGWT